MAVIILREYLIVSGISLATPAYFSTDLSDVRRPADQKGKDRDIPKGQAIPKPRRRTISKRSLPLLISGNVDADGVAIADYQAGADSHIKYLNDNVVDPIETGDGTRAATLVVAGVDRAANIHVEGLEIGRRVGPYVWATLQISIPGGEFF